MFQQHMPMLELSYQVQPTMQGMVAQGSLSYSNAATWIMDIGESYHMTSDLASLNQFLLLKVLRKYRLAMVKVYRLRILDLQLLKHILTLLF